MGESVSSASVVSSMANNGRKNNARYPAGSGGIG